MFQKDYPQKEAALPQGYWIGEQPPTFSFFFPSSDDVIWSHKIDFPFKIVLQEILLA